MLHSEDNQCVCTISEIMVLGLMTKNRKGVLVKVDYIVHVQEIKPWPPSQSLRLVQSVVFQWEKRRVLKKMRENSTMSIFSLFNSTIAGEWRNFGNSTQLLIDSLLPFLFYVFVFWFIENHHRYIEKILCQVGCFLWVGNMETH